MLPMVCCGKGIPMTTDLRPIKKILLATGLSTESVGAVLQATAMAKLFGAELHAGHVIEPVSATTERAIPGLAEKQEQHAREELEIFAESHGLAGVAELHVLRGEPEAQLLTLRKDLDADLLVIGRYGRGGLKRGRLGSIADRVLRHCQVSTLVVDPDFRGSFTNIAVACDLDAEDPVELRRGLDLARSLGAGSVTLVHAYEIPHGYHTILTHEEAKERLERVWTESAEALIARVRVEGDPEVSVRAAQGSPASAVPRLVGEIGADLLVLGTHFRVSKAAAVMLGRTSEKILNAVDCSVWSETCPSLHQGFLDAIKHLFD